MKEPPLAGGPRLGWWLVVSTSSSIDDLPDSHVSGLVPVVVDGSTENSDVRRAFGWRAKEAQIRRIYGHPPSEYEWVDVDSGNMLVPEVKWLCVTNEVVCIINGQQIVFRGEKRRGWVRVTYHN